MALLQRLEAFFDFGRIHDGGGDGDFDLLPRMDRDLRLHLGADGVLQGFAVFGDPRLDLGFTDHAIADLVGRVLEGVVDELARRLGGDFLREGLLDQVFGCLAGAEAAHASLFAELAELAIELPVDFVRGDFDLDSDFDFANDLD